MNQVLAVVTTLMLMLSLMWSVDTMAQTLQLAPGAMTPGAQKPEAPGTQKEQSIEGKIKSVDPLGKEVTLEDGTRLLIPDKLRVKWEALKEGATVKASYEEKEGMNVVTRIRLQAPGS